MPMTRSSSKRATLSGCAGKNDSRSAEGIRRSPRIKANKAINATPAVKQRRVASARSRHTTPPIPPDSPTAPDNADHGLSRHPDGILAVGDGRRSVMARKQAIVSENPHVDNGDSDGMDSRNDKGDDHTKHPCGMITPPSSRPTTTEPPSANVPGDHNGGRLDAPGATPGGVDAMEVVEPTPAPLSLIVDAPPSSSAVSAIFGDNDSGHLDVATPATVGVDAMETDPPSTDEPDSAPLHATTDPTDEFGLTPSVSSDPDPDVDRLCVDDVLLSARAFLAMYDIMPAEVDMVVLSHLHHGRHCACGCGTPI